jgi:hypothetical protein
LRYFEVALEVDWWLSFSAGGWVRRVIFVETFLAAAEEKIAKESEASYHRCQQ